MKDRILWIDALRGFCFIIVIYNHIAFRNPDIVQFVNPCALPAFFFVSGFLFKDSKSFLYVFEHRTRTLFIPFLIFGSFLLLMRYAFSSRELVPMSEAFSSLLLQDGRDNVIWFIPASYVYSLIFFWVCRCFGSSVLLFVAATLIAAANWILREFVGIEYLPYGLATAGFAFYWMSLGLIFKHHQHLERYITLCGFLISATIFSSITIISGTNFRYFAAHDFFLWVIAATAALYCAIYLARTLFVNSRLVRFIGSNSMVYFIFFSSIFPFLQKIIYALVPSAVLEIPAVFNLAGVAVTLFDALAMIPVALVINRYFPFTIGKKYRLPIRSLDNR